MSDQNTWVIHLSGIIYWRLREYGPTEVVVPFLPDWTLVVPTAHAPFAGTTDVCVKSGGEILIGREEIVMRSRRPRSRSDSPLEEAPRLLAALRYLSHQQTIPRTISAASFQDISPFSVEQAPAVPSIFTRDYFVRCAVTTDHLDALARLPADFSVLVHVDVLLDALEAHVEADFRKAILYAAIAIESHALYVLEKAHSDALSKRSAIHRVAEIPVGDGKTAIKDPIYDVLAGGENFGRLLHERPLYLMGRSLLLEDQGSYRRARALYATRNKLAHRGSTPEDENHLPISSEGARQGLDTAIEVFRWLGDAGPYVPYGCFVPFPEKREAAQLTP
jgi:hypothetical protein